jgi:glutamate formiminotransferase
MFECVINISEGRDPARIAVLSRAGGLSLRDVHSDPEHHRSVFTLINDAETLMDDVSRLISTASELVDISDHVGVHPRRGAIDVVPFVALSPDQAHIATHLRDLTARFVADELHIPVFLYGPLPPGGSRTLPGIRRHAFVDLDPDYGPSQPHPTCGASALGSREILVAWNLWIEGIDGATARSIAREVRSSAVRALGFESSSFVQVSVNVIDVTVTRPSEVYDRVAELLPRGARIQRTELVGLIPRALLEREDPRRWDQLGLSASVTIESRLGH